MGSQKNGKDGKDLYISVPCGTLVFTGDADRGFLGELLDPGDALLVAKGGSGGRGNASFASSINRIPRFADRGEAGEELWISLELRLIADVGIVGFPNAGKSTFLSKITRAEPKIAPYPFTTLEPNLGVYYRNEFDGMIFADIPGIIEGASEGAGLGLKFLRHIDRTKMILILLDISAQDPEKPLYEYNALLEELRRYSPRLAEKPRIIAANKMDLDGEKEKFEVLAKSIEKEGMDVLPVSAIQGDGIPGLLKRIVETYDAIEEPERDLALTPVKKKTPPKLEISKEEGRFVVRGKGIEKMVARTDLHNDDAVLFLQQRFRRMGLEEELKKKGIKEGDVVLIADYEFDYFEDGF